MAGIPWPFLDIRNDEQRQADELNIQNSQMAAATKRLDNLTSQVDQETFSRLAMEDSPLGEQIRKDTQLAMFGNTNTPLPTTRQDFSLDVPTEAPRIVNDGFGNPSGFTAPPTSQYQSTREVPMVWRSPQQQFAEKVRQAQDPMEIYAAGVGSGVFKGAHGGLAMPNEALVTGGTANYRNRAAAQNSLASAGLHEAQAGRVPYQIQHDIAATGKENAYANRAMNERYGAFQPFEDETGAPLVMQPNLRGGDPRIVQGLRPPAKSQGTPRAVLNPDGTIGMATALGEGQAWASPVDIDTAKANNPRRLLEKAETAYRQWAQATRDPGGPIGQLLMTQMAQSNPEMAAAMSNPQEFKRIAGEEMTRLTSEIQTHRAALAGKGRPSAPAPPVQAAPAAPPAAPPAQPRQSAGPAVGSIVNYQGKRYKVMGIKDGKAMLEPAE